MNRVFLTLVGFVAGGTEAYPTGVVTHTSPTACDHSTTCCRRGVVLKCCRCGVIAGGGPDSVIVASNATSDIAEVLQSVAGESRYAHVGSVAVWPGRERSGESPIDVHRKLRRLLLGECEAHRDVVSP